MKRLFISGAAVAAATVALAACGGSGGMNSSSSAAPSSGGTATVSVKKVGSAGAVLVDAAGKALYASTQESSGKVLCTGSCTSIWVPLTVASGAPKGNDVGGTLGTVMRPGGARQVTFNGMPLYSFQLDQVGQVTGNGAMDAFGGRHFTWHVIQRGGATTSTGSTSSGQSGGTSNGYGY
jgi:predicted lipoprotein with Yx(FWY)xxD motif